MSKLFSRIAGFFTSRNFVGVDKAGNRYFTRVEEVDGIMKEKRWVKFKGEEDPTSIPVEWICWLNGQRKKAPTPEEMIELEARRELTRQNVALLKKEEEERRAKEGSFRKTVGTGKVGGPDLKSFIQQFPTTPEGQKPEEESYTMDKVRKRGEAAEVENAKEPRPACCPPMCSLPAVGPKAESLAAIATAIGGWKPLRTSRRRMSSEPSGSGATFRPGTWQPPT